MGTDNFISNHKLLHHMELLIVSAHDVLVFLPKRNNLPVIFLLFSLLPAFVAVSAGVSCALYSVAEIGPVIVLVAGIFYE